MGEIAIVTLTENEKEGDLERVRKESEIRDEGGESAREHRRGRTRERKGGSDREREGSRAGERAKLAGE